MTELAAPSPARRASEATAHLNRELDRAGAQLRVATDRTTRAVVASAKNRLGLDDRTLVEVVFVRRDQHLVAVAARDTAGNRLGDNGALELLSRISTAADLQRAGFLVVAHRRGGRLRRESWTVLV